MKKVLILITTIVLVLSFSTIAYGAKLDKKTARTVPKQTFKLKVKGAKKVKWSSNNKSVATVIKGKVKTYKNCY